MSFSIITAHELCTLELIIRVLFATIIGAVVGAEREHKNRPAGLRTHVLVCIGACTIALIECLYTLSLNGQTDGHVTYNFGRLCAQVISGIGFLGAGTIFTAQKKITGLTTAASLWNIACLGLASGYGYYWAAAIGCVLVLMTLTLMQKVIRVNAMKRVEVQFINRNETIAFINDLFAKNNIKVLDLDFHVKNADESNSESTNIYTNIYSLHLPPNMNYADLINALSAHSNIQIVHTTNT